MALVVANSKWQLWQLMRTSTGSRPENFGLCSIQLEPFLPSFHYSLHHCYLHLATIELLCRAISSQLRHVSTMSNLRNIEPLEYRTFGMWNLRNIEPSEYRPITDAVMQVAPWYHWTMWSTTFAEIGPVSK